MGLYKKTKDYIWITWQFTKKIWQYPVSTITPGTHFDYDAYWKVKRGEGSYMGTIGGWQKRRAIIASEIISQTNSKTLNDIGSGAGEVAFYIKNHSTLEKIVAYDSSKYALEYAKEKGFETVFFDINKKEDYSKLQNADFTILFEILEHVPGSEELLETSTKISKNGVMFSFPNTGFIIHRFRLLFGKFPLQWERHPGEHLRFWTKKDLLWWLKAQGYTKYQIHYYVGVPFLKKLWPSMFAAGFFVYLRK